MNTAKKSKSRPAYAYTTYSNPEIATLFYKHSYGVEELAEMFNVPKIKILTSIGSTATLASMGC